MKKIIYLSHFIKSDTPLYGGANAIKINQAKSIHKGDSCNTHNLSFPNHAGTHIDFPLHFSDTGKSLNNYSPAEWIFYSPFILDYESSSAEIIDFGNTALQIPRETDFLLIRTGFQKLRGTDEYWKQNPGLNPDLANKLRMHCRDLRAIGFDFISLSSYQHRDIGRKAHVEFLINNDILIIEDMNLADLSGRIIKIICLPLLVDNIDGSPVTVIAELEK